jgi:hypothetical protein
MSGFSLTGAVSGALVLGYGRIPERDVDLAVAALARILGSAGSLSGRLPAGVGSGVVAQ